jgi:hypothetical protein
LRYFANYSAREFLSLMALRVGEVNAVFLLLMIFSGNAVLFGIDIFFPIVLCSIMVYFLFAAGNQFQPSTFVWIGLMICVSYSFIYLAYIAEIPYNTSYFVWPIKFVIMILVVSLLGEFNFGRLVFFALVFISFLSVLMSTMVDGRMYSFFGPNMLYRLFVILVFYSIFGYVHSFLRLYHCVFGIVFGIVLTFATGSVGGLVALAFGAFYCGLLKLNLKVVLALSFFLFVCYLSLDTIAPRLIYKVANFESQGRWLSWISIYSESDFITPIKYESLSHIWSDGFAYPHNILIELILFYGIFSYVAIFLLLIPLLKKGSSPIHMIFSVFLIGALLSGDLSDNYPVLVLGFAIVVRIGKFNWLKQNESKEMYI